MDPPRGRGVQFPFAVTDRVIIKVSSAQAWYIILVQKLVVSYNWSGHGSGEQEDTTALCWA